MPADLDPARRILVLVPHEPEEDPRVKWVTQLCAAIGRTDVLGATHSTARCSREYDGVVYLERVNVSESASARALRRARRLGRWGEFKSVKLYGERQGLLPSELQGVSRLRPWIYHQGGAALRHVANSAGHDLLSDALYRRGRAVSIRPRVIVCHDIFALVAGVRIKRLYGGHLLYDSHEYWPEADLIAQRWQNRLVARQERRLVREADTVVAVTPGLARQIEELYGLGKVLSVPNAAPFEAGVRPSCDRPPNLPVKFLVQGRAGPRRGYFELVSAWRRLGDAAAVLYFRCPPNPYLDQLRAAAADLETAGRIVFLPHVSEDELVDAAAFADVGVITYPIDSLVHLHACPNKLSQYMHAGLAILSNELAFVQEVTSRADCGLTFDLNAPDTLAAGVRRLVDNPDLLSRLKKNAHRAGRDWFNWAVQAEPYRQALESGFNAQAR